MGQEQASIPAQELRAFFHECDTYRTGQVHAQDLVRTIQGYAQTSQIDKWALEDLSLGLDPQRDNAFIDCATFIAITQAWALKVRQDQIDQDQENDPAHQSSFGLLNQSDFAGSSESDGPLALCSSKIDPNMTELSGEIQVLKRALQKLSDEKTSLQRQYSTSDDLCSQLQTENQTLKARLEATLASLDVASKYQLEYEELKSLSMAKEERCSDLRGLLESNHDKIRDLLQENHRLQTELGGAQDALTLARKNTNDAVGVTEKLKHEAEVLRETNQEKTQELDKLRNLLLACERKVMKAMEETEIKTAEIESLRASLSKMDDELRRATLEGVSAKIAESPEVDADSVFEGGVTDDGLWYHINRRSIGPKFFSTPFEKRLVSMPRESIGDEIKEMGVGGKSPFCEKPSDDEDTQETRALTHITVERGSTPVCQDPWQYLLPIAILVLGTLVIVILFGKVKLDHLDYYPILWPSAFPEPFTIFELSRSTMIAY
ncbi:uncharacterized protein LOC131884473 isoform X3 [Tigriopus californicus]|uniref:uncharacterized protein LOC131884473 isoform X3 n=1 Tax=Tigriopus californicus TaxID=6832 RepID=UPI0027D9E368|nr:uncharacterized protein LOC131884473 isoform X3 [Tigriopus californicus]|eukprot:TCALIF_04194-PA protein Name:"Similar to Ccdc155 Protein KASH5 (Mus musculus)" AED:0.00 eAED:0.00 QI:262/1/1/1/1/1/2/628/490